MDIAAFVIAPGEWLAESAWLEPWVERTHPALAMALLAGTAWAALFVALVGFWRAWPRLTLGARLSPRDAWGVLWRIEAVHLLVFVLPVVVAATAKVLGFYVFLPFSVMSFHDQTAPLAHWQPLDRPACWTFASWCPIGETDAALLPAKAIVFVAALAWIAAWKRRASRRRAASRAG